MIKSLEIKNFESHKHTVLKDFSAGFNLICGRSNQGKTSILRALKAVCFNEFNPKSIRVGAKYCEITLVTDKGKVYVKKGPKDNHWETTKEGEKAQVWDKVGKNLPEAVEEITGMRLVSLGGIEFNANFMDQLSAHFMLASIDDKKASPSDRVRIVDAISGLSGVEELIRDISATNKSNAKAVGDGENAIKELQSKKYEPLFLEKEKEVLGEASKIIDGLKKERQSVKDCERALNDKETARRGLSEAKEKLKSLPDVGKAAKLAAFCQEDLEAIQNAEKAMMLGVDLKRQIKECKDKLAGFPEGLDEKCEAAEKETRSLSLALKAFAASEKVKKELEDRKKALAGLPDVEATRKIANKASMLINLITEGGNLLQRKDECLKKLTECRQKAETEKEKGDALEKQIHELLGTVEICPFCGKTIGKDWPESESRPQSKESGR